MITKLKEIERKLIKLGYSQKSHTNTHTVFFKNGFSNVIIPKRKSKDIGKPLYFSIIKQTGLTVQQFENI